LIKKVILKRVILEHFNFCCSGMKLEILSYELLKIEQSLSDQSESPINPLSFKSCPTHNGAYHI
jgi:hypothetical protein